MRELVTVFTALAICVSLAGCERAGVGPAALSREGSYLLFAVCVDIRVVEIYAVAEGLQVGDGPVVVAELTGDAALTAGEPFGGGAPPLGLTGAWEPVDHSTLRSVDAIFVGHDESDTFQASFSGRDVLDLQPGKWLSTNGQVRDTPCRDAGV